MTGISPDAPDPGFSVAMTRLSRQLGADYYDVTVGVLDALGVDYEPGQVRAKVTRSMARLQIEERAAAESALFGERLMGALDRALRAAAVPVKTRQAVWDLLSAELTEEST